MLALLGVRLNFDLAWMFLADPKELHDKLFETAFYFHAYPPGMNILAGLFLKLGGAHAALLAEFAHGGLGLMLANSLLFALRSFAVPRAPAFATATLFTLAPPTIYLEHIWLWEEWVAALLGLAAVLLFRALKRPSFPRLLAFFAVCSAISWIRSTFQLTWYFALVGLTLWFVSKTVRRRVVLAALGPLALLLGLYLKNWAFFGVFGASTAGGGNLTHVTVSRLPAETKADWIRTGKLSPVAGHSVYAGPSEYLAYVDPAQARQYPQVEIVQELERPTVHAPNYNHWIYLPVNRLRERDAFTYLAERPRNYVSTTIEGIEQFFGPTTHWHPFDKTERSPHHAHRLVLGKYERFYNRLLHRLPLEGPGIYVFLPIALIWGAFQVRDHFRSRVRERRARTGLLVFALFQIAYVSATSMLFTIGESSRYRYQVEALIWLVAVLALVAAWHELGLRGRRTTAR